MAANRLNILTPSVNNLTARIFVRAAGLEFEEVDVWGKTTEAEYLAKYPAHLTPTLEEEAVRDLCRARDDLVGSAFDLRRPLLQRRRLVRQVLERGNRQARRWASGNVCWPGRPTNAATPRKARLGHLVAFAVHARRTNSGRSSDI